MTPRQTEAPAYQINFVGDGGEITGSLVAPSSAPKRERKLDHTAGREKGIAGWFAMAHLPIDQAADWLATDPATLRCGEHTANSIRLTFDL